MSNCLLDISILMLGGYLKLNNSKLNWFFPTVIFLPQHSASQSMATPLSQLFKSKPKSFLDLSLQSNHVGKSCYSHFKIYLESDSFSYPLHETSLVLTTILSHLNYCNNLIIGLTASNPIHLQFILQRAVRSIILKCKSDHGNPVLKTLQWLPISPGIKKSEFHNGL